MDSNQLPKLSPRNYSHFHTDNQAVTSNQSSHGQKEGEDLKINDFGVEHQPKLASKEKRTKKKLEYAYRQSKSVLNAHPSDQSPKRALDHFDSVSMISPHYAKYQRRNQKTFELYNQLASLHGYRSAFKPDKPEQQSSHAGGDAIKGKKKKKLKRRIASGVTSYNTHYEGVPTYEMVTEAATNMSKKKHSMKKPNLQFGFNTRYDVSPSALSHAYQSPRGPGYQRQEKANLTLHVQNNNHEALRFGDQSQQSQYPPPVPGSNMTSQQHVLAHNSSIQQISVSDQVSEKGRSRSTNRQASTIDHAFGHVFAPYGTIGPSELLKASGSKSTLPKMGDYHANLKKLHRYVKAGPAEYNLPVLFDNYNKNSLAVNLKKNPQHHFGRKDPAARLISKQHVIDNIGIDTPGVGLYEQHSKGSFDHINKQFSPMRKFDASLRLKLHPEQPTQPSYSVPATVVGTFPTQKRFHEPKTMNKIREAVPHSYQKLPQMGVPKKAVDRQIIPLGDRLKENLSKNKTFFGMPTKNEGPGPSAYIDNSKLAFKLQDNERIKLERQKNQIAADNSKGHSRFKITSVVGHKEYAKDLIAATTSHYPSPLSYKQEVPFQAPKNFTVPQQRRDANNLPKKVDTVSPQSYNVLSGHGYVDQKNFDLISRLSQKKFDREGSKQSLTNQGPITIIPMNTEFSLKKLRNQQSNEQLISPANQLTAEKKDRHQLSQSDFLGAGLQASPAQEYQFNSSAKSSQKRLQSYSVMQSSQRQLQIQLKDQEDGVLIGQKQVLKSTYRIKGGKFPGAHRQNMQF